MIIRKTLMVLAALCLLTSAEAADKKKLKIVFLMGQSNMVGYSTPATAWYLTQPMYVPPAETATARTENYGDGSFYWQGLDFSEGDTPEFNAKGKALIEERKASRSLWRQRAYGNFSRKAVEEGIYAEKWNHKEWGEPPKTSRKYMVPFLDKKAREEGIYQRMIDHIEDPQNKRHPKVVMAELSKRDEIIADDLKQVKELLVKGTKPEDFDALAIAKKEFGRINHTNRQAFAELVKKHVNLPIAERTYISAYGQVSGEATEHAGDKVTQGKLTVGYGVGSDRSGPEYAFGISYEQMVDGPVLLVKCSWGGTSVHVPWRPPSLANAETPIEKAEREKKNKEGAASAKKNGNSFTPAEPQTGPGGCWERAMAHVQKVLADPGKFHPDYDADAGYEIAGLVWFQGWNDLPNKAYGEQLVHFIKDFRKEVKSPKMPVVTGLVGHATWANTTFDSNVNSGMLYASKHKDLMGTVDVVNTVKYFPVELGLLKSVKAAFGEESDEYKKAQATIPRSCSNSGLHYFGSAKFLGLTGNAMAHKLHNLNKGGKPSIHKEAEDIIAASK